MSLQYQNKYHLFIPYYAHLLNKIPYETTYFIPACVLWIVQSALCVLGCIGINLLIYAEPLRSHDQLWTIQTGKRVFRPGKSVRLTVSYQLKQL